MWQKLSVEVGSLSQNNWKINQKVDCYFRIFAKFEWRKLNSKSRCPTFLFYLSPIDVASTSMQKGFGNGWELAVKYSLRFFA